MTRQSSNSASKSASASPATSSPTPTRPSSTSQACPFATKTDVKKRIDDLESTCLSEISMHDYNTHVLIEDVEVRQQQLFYELNSRFEARVKVLADEVHQLRKSHNEMQKRDEGFVDVLQAHTDQCASFLEVCKRRAGQASKSQQNGSGDAKKGKSGPQSRATTVETPANGSKSGTQSNTTTVEAAPTDTDDKSSEPATTTSSAPPRGATFPWPPIPPGPHDAKKDFTDLVPFTSFTGQDFDKWSAAMDRLWYGHKDPLYRADFLTAFRTEAKGTIAFWIIGADPNFLRQATWPDIRAQMREYFSSEKKGKIELEQWRQFLADARGGNDFLNSVGTEDLRKVMPVIEKSGTAYVEIKRADGKPWGASLASGPLSGIFSRGVGTKDKEPENGQSQPASTAASTPSPTSKQKQKQASSTAPSPTANKQTRVTTTVPMSLLAAGHSAATTTASAAPTPASASARQSAASSPASSVKTAPSPTPSVKTASSPNPSVKTASSLTPSVKTASSPTPSVKTASSPPPSAKSTSTPHTATSTLPPLRSDKGSPHTAKQPSPTPPTFEDLVDVVGTYNGDPKAFAKWSRKVDDLWYANDDPLYRNSLMKALPSTLTFAPLTWLANDTGTVDFLQKASWNDWKVVLGAHWGGSYAVTEGTTSPFLSRVRGQGQGKRKSTL